MSDDVVGALSALPMLGIIPVLRSIDQDNTFVKEICSFWDVVFTDVDSFGNISEEQKGHGFAFDPFLSSFLQTLRFSNTTDIYEKYADIKEEMEGLLSKFDTGIKSVEIKRKKSLDDNEISPEKINITTKHGIDGKLVDMDFMHDSAGTRQMYLILAHLLKTKKDGGFVAIDEIDINLHPHLLEEMINLFLGEVVNKKNAQFLFSSHAHLLMNKIDKHQIHIVEKGENGESGIYRLDSVKGVRSAENYFGKYLAGVYGGVPNIY